jgi:flavodoxin
MKILLVFYSRTGRTKKIAEEINRSLNGDIEEIFDSKNRNGFIGWLSSGRDAGTKSITKIRNVKKDPSKYDIIVIGSPTWNGTISTPIRTYITEFKEKLRNVALFSTGDGEDLDAINDMDSLIEGKSIAKMHLVRKDEVETGKYVEKLDSFISEIKSARG